MTQEELDALMAGDIDEEVALLEEESSENEVKSQELDSQEEPSKIVIDQENYRVDARKQWPPPPPTEDHQVVNQLDNVTKDSEKKATEIMDKLEEINNFMLDIEEDCNTSVTILERNIEVFEKLSEKFPDIETFTELLGENKKAVEHAKSVIEKSQFGADEIMMIMDIMQYQDIHRQKIERVINVMRALSKYMNSLFASDLEDAKRVTSAVHIAGDTDTDELVNNEEIEALLESFGKK